MDDADVCARDRLAILAHDDSGKLASGFLCDCERRRQHGGESRAKGNGGRATDRATAIGLQQG
jgi:hypothetical protein